MTNPRTKHDLSPCTLDLTGIEGPLDWSVAFGNGHPVEVEIGSGKGLFLQNAATARPGHNFVGVEIAKKYARRAAERAIKHQLDNVRVHAGDAIRFMRDFVPSASLTAVHVYFPDPWWKARHKKRRVFAEPLMRDIERTLIPGSDLWIATDVEEYHGVILELVARYRRFTQEPWLEPGPAAHELDYLTNFERKYRIEGRPIHRAHYRFD